MKTMFQVPEVELLNYDDKDILTQSFVDEDDEGTGGGNSGGNHT